MAGKKVSPVVYRNGRHCFNRAAALPEGCAPHSEDPLVLVIKNESPDLIARALWTEGIKAVVVRTGKTPENVQALRERMKRYTPADAAWIGRGAIGRSDDLKDAAALLSTVQTEEKNKLSALFRCVAGLTPELEKVLFRPLPPGTPIPQGYGFHDDTKVTLAGLNVVYGPGTDWISGYQEPKDTAKRAFLETPDFYHYGSPGDPNKDVRILSAEEGDMIFFFGRSALRACPAFPSFIHSSPPFQEDGTDSRLALACYTKKTVEFPGHIRP